MSHCVNSCIPGDYHCDNEKDCMGGEDEVDCGMCVFIHFKQLTYLYLIP